mgnify:CR=1 FL=1|tara:strand:+ start:155 stop:445 length:291 start_codon:yes stop_codon:yes gene_type:complete
MKKGITASIWLVIALIANYLDATFTLYAISLGVEEANPVMAWALEISPMFFMALKLGLFTCAAVFISEKRPGLLPWVTMLYMSVVAWHLIWLSQIT